jgi:hypothetical protein
MRIDSSGNVGIGLSSPSSYANDDNSLAVLGQVRIQGVTNTAAVPILALRDNNSGLFAPAANTIAISTGAGERMRINSSGIVLVGTTSPSASYLSRMELKGPESPLSIINETATDASGRVSIAFRNAAGTIVGNVGVSNIGTAFNTTSDYRLKENVDYTFDATTRLKKLKPARFNFIAQPDNTIDGFMAHEVQDIVPEAITGQKDAMKEEEYEVTPEVLDEDGNVVTEAVWGTRTVPDYQGIDQSKLVPLLTKAIQEQQTIIDDLKSRLDEAGL